MTKPALPLKYWPFDLVPRPGAPLIWAARKELGTDLTTLGRRLGRHSAVTLHLLWADFGAGKTHALLYLKQRIEQREFGSMVPIYCALPKGCQSFLDVYKAIVRSIPADLLGGAFAEAQSNVGRERLEREMDSISPGLTRCLIALSLGGVAQRSAAISWLRGESGIPLRVLQGLSIHGRIRSVDEAVAALAGIVGLFVRAGSHRVVFLLDEFQRVEVLRKQQQDEINAGLHGFFNSCGQGMSLVLSFSFGNEANVRHFLNAELLSRVDPLRISIPALSVEHGVEFLEEIVGRAREDQSVWPVEDAVIPLIVRSVSSRFALTPRRLMKAAGLVFDLASNDLEDGVIEEVTKEYVDGMVARGEFDRIDDSMETS